ncbi:hypothetical protein C7420_1024 [Pantoea ananatis]|uniref:hypothetical protein n=1 Tax=Pantoea ananas TaxID=553 RepID=UPI000DC2F16D|nr:hypothetical protein [Pantoea ananatis]RAR72978.1 hypothetical protein C7420_1024 [Pantoea ananatis]
MILRQYQINADLVLNLSKNCLDHVLNGDITDKVFQINGKRIAEKVITGGLHSYTGWRNFLLRRPGLKKVSFFDFNKDSEWYYERELQNGTILLKLPESVFTSKAAKMTLYPENNYKSGYLWKTIFPKHIDENSIIDILDEALSNISQLECRDGELICYYKVEVPLECMRISVLYRNGEINSFYPTWSQPNTGNNGKPFSFFDNIGHVVSESSLIDTTEQLNLATIGLFSSLSRFLDLPTRTPNVFLDRNNSNLTSRSWESKRIQILKDYVDNCTANDIEEIYKYVNDEAICKYHDKITQHAYEHYYPNIQSSVVFYNSICLNQNIFESIYILFFFDQKYSTNFYSETASTLVSNMFTSPLIDMWVKKRIHHILISLTLDYHDLSFPAKYLDMLATSPTRRELFSEYFYESHEKKNNFRSATNLEDIGNLFGIISLSHQNLPVLYSNFLHYFSENLGESYSLHFNDDERKNFLFESYPNEHYIYYVKDTLKYFSTDIFTSFTFYLKRYFKHFHTNQNPKPVTLSRITYEYFKLQVAQRYRINLNYAKYHDGAIIVTFPPRYDDVCSVILKHERISNRQLTDELMATTKEYLHHIKDIQLEKTLRDIESKDRKEIPRFPIPYDLIIDMVKKPEELDKERLKFLKLI